MLSIGLGLLTRIGVTTGFWTFSAVLFLVGVGLGLFMQTLVVAAQNSVAQTDLGVTTSTVSFARTLGGALGASVLGAALLAHQAAVLPAELARHGRPAGGLYAFTAGMDRAYPWAVLVGLLAFALSFFLRDLPMRNTNATGNDAGAATPPTGTPAPLHVA